MRTIAQCHEGKERPLIINRRISPLLRPKPALHLGTSIASSVSSPPQCGFSKLGSPSMMEAHHRHQRQKSMPIAIAAARHRFHVRRCSSRTSRFLSRALHPFSRRAVQRWQNTSIPIPFSVNLSFALLCARRVPARLAALTAS